MPIVNNFLSIITLNIQAPLVFSLQEMYFRFKHTQAERWRDGKIFHANGNQ